jgi:ATP-binding cassette subfamily D (ALD) long-chain fatty acid import protein
LTISGDALGSWELRQVGSAEERMELDREIETLEAKLREVERWKVRVEELNAILNATVKPP